MSSPTSPFRHPGNGIRFCKEHEIFSFLIKRIFLLRRLKCYQYRHQWSYSAFLEYRWLTQTHFHVLLRSNFVSWRNLEFVFLKHLSIFCFLEFLLYKELYRNDVTLLKEGNSSTTKENCPPIYISVGLLIYYAMFYSTCNSKPASFKVHIKANLVPRKHWIG